MNIFSENAIGHIVNLKTSHPLHNNGIKKEQPDDNVSGSFADTLMKAIGKVNNLLVDSSQISQKMINDPGSVDIHNVMIAAQKAEISLNFTKSVRDEAIKSYRELMNLR